MSSQATLATTLAEWMQALDSSALPAAVQRASADTLIDTLGLAIAARNSDYVQALRTAWPGEGPSTMFGATDGRAPEAAAMINGTAAHGEDFDNTFEGCPVHPGAVIVAAVLAAAEARGLTGADALRGIAVGQELMCRLGTLAQKGIHAAGFHPTAVTGALGAAAAVAAAARIGEAASVHALGIAGSMASGIIEYLADGSWTKRMHAGWAAQSGLRAVAMAEAGFTGPASVIEGKHGFFRAFAPSVSPDFEELTAGLGELWQGSRVAFKPYACGTMTQPFIDCAIALAAKGVAADDVVELRCPVGEGTVHRLWEPLALKRKPPTPYAAKFSTPFCIAVGFLRGAAGLAEFSELTVRDPSILSLCERVVYEVNPNDEYPGNYSGAIRATLSDGSVVATRQAHLRGGSREPLPRVELLDKCRANLVYGQAGPELAERIARFADGLAADERPVALAELRL